MYFILFLTLFSLTKNSLSTFPLGSCTNTNCEGSPYDFVWSLVDQKAGLFCFNLVNNKANSLCASSFRANMRKFVIRSQPLCLNAFKQVNIDGHKKTGGVFFDTFNNDTEAELRVTAMSYTNNTVPQVSFCIILNPPCNDIITFCGGNTCYYSVYDPYTHECCPVCAFRASNNIINLPPLPQKSPPLPPQPQLQPPTPPQSMVCGINIPSLNCSCSCSSTM